MPIKETSGYKSIAQRFNDVGYYWDLILTKIQ